MDGNKKQTLTLTLPFKEKIKEKISKGLEKVSRRSNNMTLNPTVEHKKRSGFTSTIANFTHQGLEQEEEKRRMSALLRSKKTAEFSNSPSSPTLEKNKLVPENATSNIAGPAIDSEKESLTETSEKSTFTPSSDTKKGEVRKPTIKQPINSIASPNRPNRPASGYSKNAKLNTQFSNNSRPAYGSHRLSRMEEERRLVALKSAQSRIIKPININNVEDKPLNLVVEPTKVAIPKVKTLLISQGQKITLRQLSIMLSQTKTKILHILDDLEVDLKENEAISTDLIDLIAHELGYVLEYKKKNIVEEVQDTESDLKERPPVVTIMGHVDHGKTTLLDAIRDAHVAAGESGGITQHIGAYQIVTKGGKTITFIDTPGHAAFTAMRLRGALATDIVILVVAADDGVSEQTIEAINHTKAAGVPIIVAVNKIDKPNANPSKALNELLQHDVIVEELGGEALCVLISALKKINLDKLEEAILFQAEIMELKANYNCKAKGIVIESELDKQRGVLTTLLVQRGKLQLGDVIVAGKAYGKVRGIIDCNNKNLKIAFPSTPATILGFNQSPEAGELFAVVETEKQARDTIAQYINAQALKKEKIKGDFSSIFSSDKKQLCLIVKADVNGSLEAITDYLDKIHTEEVEVKIIHKGVGSISPSDVTLAEASNAFILAFRVKGDKKIPHIDKINLRYYSVIYDLIDDVNLLVKGLFAPQIKEVALGTVEIRQVFNVSKIGRIAGCYVLSGLVKRGSNVRLLRDNKVIYEGVVKVLRRFKDDAKEVKAGFDCGILLQNYDDIKEADILEVYELVEQKIT